MAAEHEVLIANSALDPGHGCVLELRLRAKEVFKDGEGDHFEVGVVVEHNGSFEDTSDSLGDLLGDV